MMRKILLSYLMILAALWKGFLPSPVTAQEADTLLREIGDIRIRDPFILTDAHNQRYILVASISQSSLGCEGMGVLHEQGPTALATAGRCIHPARRFLG